MDIAKRDTVPTLTIDAGGTTTRLRFAMGNILLMNDGSVPSNPTGDPPALPELPVLPTVVVAGITKVSRAGVVDSWQVALRSHYPSALIVVIPDYELAAGASIYDSQDVMLLAGTGSLACVYVDETLIRIGGRGWEFGDEGSASHVTSELIKRTIRSMDGLVVHTPLTLAVVELSETCSTGDFAAWSRHQCETISRGFLAPFISSKAESNDLDAINLLRGMGGWLARLAHTAALLKPASSRIDVTLVGGFWDSGPWIAQSCEQALGKWYTKVSMSRFTGTHLSGSLGVVSTLSHRNKSDVKCV